MIKGWIKNRFTDLKYTAWLAENWQKLKKEKRLLTPFLYFWILYPFIRLVIGREKASKLVVERFVKNNFFVLLPIANGANCFAKIRGVEDFDIFREVCIEDHYGYSEIKPGWVVVDAGAHIGLFSLSASLKTGPSGKVIAIEPEENNSRQLNDNLSFNKIKNVLPMKIGISDSNGEEKFFVNQSQGAHSFFSSDQSVGEVLIKVKKLDTLLEELKIKKVDMMKIDTEGAEMKILKGAQKILAENPKLKMVIAAYHYPNEAEEVVEYLKKMNFQPKIHRGVFDTVIV